MIHGKIMGTRDKDELTRPWYTADEVAARFHVERNTIYNWRKQGKITAMRMGTSDQSHLRFSRDEIRDFEKRNLIIPIDPEEVEEAKAWREVANQAWGRRAIRLKTEAIARRDQPNAIDAYYAELDAAAAREEGEENTDE